MNYDEKTQLISHGSLAAVLPSLSIIKKAARGLPLMVVRPA